MMSGGVYATSIRNDCPHLPKNISPARTKLLWVYQRNAILYRIEG